MSTTTTIEATEPAAGLSDQDRELQVRPATANSRRSSVGGVSCHYCLRTFLKALADIVCRYCPYMGINKGKNDANGV